MARSEKGDVFVGRTVGRGGDSRVFSSITGPGLGKTSNMDRGVFEKAVRSANTILRTVTSTSSSEPDVRRK